MTKGKFLYYSFLLVLSVFLAFFYYKNYHYIDISAPDLSVAYTQNLDKADNDFLNKKINVRGQVKAYYKILKTRPVLELKTYENNLPIFCFFKSEKEQKLAGRIPEDNYVEIKGICVGIHNYNFVNGIKIDVDEIKEIKE